jgi:hypothetical protein
MILDGTILNADINASAAIAGTKISPNFGSQNVVTTGTATAASLIPTGSSVPTNGVYLPAANSVAISTNGSNRLHIASDGKVGIGTTSPSQLFHVAGIVRVGANNASTAELEVGAGATGNREAIIDLVGDTTHTNWGMRLIRGGSGANTTSAVEHRGTGNLILNALDAGTILFATNGSERARIDSSGRLLVGTSSQSGGSLLQVNDDRIRIASSKTPASASDTGTAGEVCWDSSYIYVCTATDTWKRAALSTW